MTQIDPHGNPPLGGDHFAANATFVHPLCGAVKLNGGWPCTSPTGYVRILRSPVVPCTLGVRFRMIPMEIHHSEVNSLPSTEFSYTH